MTNKNPEYFMQEAAKTVSQRGTDNGYDAGQERSAAAVAEMFNSMYPGFYLAEEHIWSIMLSVKLVRNARKPREDNIVDLIGYAGLLGESQSAPKKVKPSLLEKRGPSMEAKEIAPHVFPTARKGLWLEPKSGFIAKPFKVDIEELSYQPEHFVIGIFTYYKSHWELKEYK